MDFYRQVCEVDAQLVSRAESFKERMIKTELRLKTANIRSSFDCNNLHITFVSENVVN